MYLALSENVALTAHFSVGFKISCRFYSTNIAT